MRARGPSASPGEQEKTRAVNVASTVVEPVVKIRTQTRRLVRIRRNMDDSSPRKGREKGLGNGVATILEEIFLSSRRERGAKKM